MTAAVRRLAWLAAGALVLGLAAGCEQSPTDSTAAANASSDRAEDRISERTVDPSGEKGARVGVEAQQNVDRAGGRMSDEVITAKVKSAIFAEPDLKSMEIDVDTVDGIVILSGTVGSPQHIENAKQAAQAVEGVKSVNTQLTVAVSG